MQRRLDTFLDSVLRSNTRPRCSGKTQAELSGDAETLSGTMSDDELSDLEDLESNLKDIDPTMKSETLVSAVRSLPGTQITPPSHLILPLEARDILNMETFSPIMQESLTRCMYQKEDVFKLMDVYFAHLNLLRHPIPKDIITQALSGIYTSNGIINQENLTQFSLISAILAVTTVFLLVSHPEYLRDLNLDISRFNFDASRRLSNASKIACGTSQGLNREDTNTIFTYVVLSRYFFVTGSLTRSWACVVDMVRLSFSLGLHRDGAEYGLDEITCEHRRVIWSIVYSSSHIYCLGYGRPPLINDDLADTRSPQPKTPMQDVPTEIRHLFGDVDPPHLLSINKVRFHLTKFISVLSFELHSVNKSFSYAKVLELHNNFCKFVSELPFYFQMSFQNGSAVMSCECDAYFPFLRAQRSHLWFDLSFFTLSLHCPYLLRMLKKGQSRQRYMTSYDTCMESVKRSLSMRRELLKSEQQGSGPRMNRTTVLAFRWFNTTVVAGILLLLTPMGSDVDILRSGMQEFIDWRLTSQHTGNEPENLTDVNTIRAFLEQDMKRRAQPDALNELESSSMSSPELKRKRLRDDDEVSKPTSANDAKESTDTECSPSIIPPPANHNLQTDIWPSNGLPFNMPFESVETSSLWPDWQPNMETDQSSQHESSGPFLYDMPGMPFDLSSSSANTSLPSLNLGGMFRFPQVAPYSGMSQRGTVPSWSMEGGNTTPNVSAQALDFDFAKNDQDAQDLLNLW